MSRGPAVLQLSAPRNTANALIPPGLADLGGQAAYNDARVQVAKLG